MSQFRPRFITFDCYGTLTDFQVAQKTREIFADRLVEGKLARFIRDFSAYRFDEILGHWKPYSEVLHHALSRTCDKYAVEFRDQDARDIYDAVPGWGPHPDVISGLSPVAERYPLVVLSNAADEQIGFNVEKLGAPFHAVFTAQQANAYKPRMQAFEYMFDMLNCGPEDVLHCSSSFRYDLMTACDLGIRNKVWVNRGHEPANPFYEYAEIKDTSGLAALVGV